MNNRQRTFLCDLHLNRETWTICARILRKWNVQSKDQPHDVICVTMVLLDEKGDKIQASMTMKHLIEQYMIQPVEGKCYWIENFKVLENNSPYRATPHAYRITFNMQTHFTESDAAIPMHSYNFLPLSDIVRNIPRTDVLVDVIGFLQTFGPLAEFRKDNVIHNKLPFTLADNENNSVSCILFGETATNAYYSKDDDIEPPIVVVMQLARLNLNNGQIQICNSWNATRIFFNQNIPEVKDMITSIKSCPSATSQSFTEITETQSSQWTTTALLRANNRITISQLMELREVCQ